ncbi:iduronate 2-sulfatase-like [Littorina saxatilis]|uniref:Sulfatase N-terminal domain-containing protein n=1 Tax=Littorina saxatilis TaxID=31220 RepID=A0AAN9G6X8_9CAEN
MAVLPFALFATLLAASSALGASSRPNVLFLVVDDLRPKLGCYGETNMVTPNIDQLAAKSIRFDRAYVQQAVCSPSRTSFLTGRRPDTTRVFDLVSYFRKVAGNYTTLPQHFKENGYITQSVGKIFHPGSASGKTDDYPYSWTFPAYHAPTKKFTGKKICPEPDGKLTHSAVCPVDLKTVPGGSLPDIQNTDFTIEFLKNRSMDHEPFFVGMGYHRPHLPFAYPKKYLDLYPLSNIHLAPNPYYPPWLPEVAWTAFKELRKYDDIKAMNISYPFGEIPLPYQLKLRQSYSAATTYTDAQVGRVLDALDKFGLADNTIITFLGDHGWQLGEHAEWTKHTNFDIAVRIPMMIHLPGVTAKPATQGKMFPFRDAFKHSLEFQPEAYGTNQSFSRPNLSEKGLSSDALVEAVDFYATIAELAGLDVPSTCPNNSFHVKFCTEGASLVPIIKNLTMTSQDDDVRKRMTWKPAVFSQYPRPSVHPRLFTDDVEEEEDEEEEEGEGSQTSSRGRTPIRIMGYTMRTEEHRYTEWIAYDLKTYTPTWSKVYARELYIYSSDPDEDVNVAKVPAFQDLATSLSQQLRAGWRKALPYPTL